jgi:di/tricarboxylate transporter
MTCFGRFNALLTAVKVSPGPVEEGAKLAGSFIESMKREPLSLALVLMNVCLLLFFYFLLKTVADQREREVGMLYADHREVRDLLARCIVPGKLSDFKLQSEQSSPIELPIPHMQP